MATKLSGEEILSKWRKNRLNWRFPIVLVLDNLRSAYNVGSIFRTAECAYIEEIVLCGITAKPPHPGVEKTALGTTSLIPWRYEDEIGRAIDKLRDKGFKIVSLELTDRSVPIQSLRREDFPLALVVGNEVFGVSQEILDRSDIIVEIPLFGEKESLNVAVAVGVALFLLIEKLREAIG